MHLRITNLHLLETIRFSLNEHAPSNQELAARSPLFIHLRKPASINCTASFVGNQLIGKLLMILGEHVHQQLS